MPALHLRGWGQGGQPGFPEREGRNWSLARLDIGHTHRGLPPSFWVPGVRIMTCHPMTAERLQHLCFERRVACFREHLAECHIQVGQYKRHVPSRIKFGTFSKLALVTTHNVTALLGALPPASEGACFPKAYSSESRNVPASIITRLVIGSIFP